ncbi:MAG: hypothetical protein ACLRPT_07335 [Akkermansia muciniphila]
MNTTSTPAIGICGGGNLAHAMAGWLGTRGLHVNILTRNPNQWGKALRYLSKRYYAPCSPRAYQ